MDTTDIPDRYHRAHDAFTAVLAAVPPHRWDAPSACADWTVRDVVGHVIWGTETVRYHLTGDEYEPPTGAPGSPDPGALTGDDPLGAWRAARAALRAVLAEADPGGSAPPRFAGGRAEATLASTLELLTLDTVVHAWDVATGIGTKVELEPDLVARSFALARLIVVRSPTTFGPRLASPPDADKQTRLLNFLGRAV